MPRIKDNKPYNSGPQRENGSAIVNVNMPDSDIAAVAKAIGQVIGSIFDYASECERTKQVMAQYTIEQGKIAFAREELNAKAKAFKELLASGEIRTQQILDQISPIKEILLDYHKVMLGQQQLYDPKNFELLCTNYHKTLDSYTRMVELLHHKNNFTLSEVTEISNQLPEIVQ